MEVVTLLNVRMSPGFDNADVPVVGRFVVDNTGVPVKFADVSRLIVEVDPRLERRGFVEGTEMLWVEGKGVFSEYERVVVESGDGGTVVARF